MKILMGIWILSLAIQTGMAQELSGTLKVRKPGFMSRNRISPAPDQDVRFRNRVDTVFRVSDSITIHWCGSTAGEIPDIAWTMPASKLELGPALSSWRIDSYVVKFYKDRNTTAWRRRGVRNTAGGFILPLEIDGVRFTKIKVRHNNGNRAIVPYLRFGNAPEVKRGWGG